MYGGDPLECPVCGYEMKIQEIITKNVESALRRLNIKTWYYLSACGHAQAGKEGDEVKKIYKPVKKAPKPRSP